MIDSKKILGIGSVVLLSNKALYIFLYISIFSFFLLFFNLSTSLFISIFIFLNSSVLLEFCSLDNSFLISEIDLSPLISCLFKSFISRISSLIICFFSAKNLSAFLLNLSHKVLSFLLPAGPIFTHSFFNFLNSFIQI